MKRAALIVSHGSKSPQSVREVLSLAEKIKEISLMEIVEPCFLSVCSPDVPAGIAKCVARGADHITVIPHFLDSGNHVLYDIPEIITRERPNYPEVVFDVLPPVGLNPDLPFLIARSLQNSQS